jgi:hypothetical protein
MNPLLSFIQRNKVYIAIALVICISISGIFIASKAQPTSEEDFIEFFKGIFEQLGIEGKPEGPLKPNENSQDTSTVQNTPTPVVKSVSPVVLPVSAVPETDTFQMVGILVVISGLLVILRVRM